MYIWGVGDEAKIQVVGTCGWSRTCNRGLPSVSLFFSSRVVAWAFRDSRRGFPPRRFSILTRTQPSSFINIYIYKYIGSNEYEHTQWFLGDTKSRLISFRLYRNAIKNRSDDPGVLVIPLVSLYRPFFSFSLSFYLPFFVSRRYYSTARAPRPRAERVKISKSLEFSRLNPPRTHSRRKCFPFELNIERPQHEPMVTLNKLMSKTRRLYVFCIIDTE